MAVDDIIYFGEKLQLIDQLEEEDKNAVYCIIDGMLTKSKFKDKIMKHVELNKYFKLRYEETTNVLVGWKPKEVSQEEDDCFSYD